MNELTNRQQRIRVFIKKFIVSNGYPPTMREIGENIGVSSSATVHIHLQKLVDKGYIKKMVLKIDLLLYWFLMNMKL